MRSDPSHVRPTRAVLAALLIAGAGLLAIGCGTGGDSSTAAQKTSGERPESTTTSGKKTSSGSSTGIASGILSSSRSTKVDSSAVGTDAEECLGKYVIDRVGESEAQQMSDAELSAYTPAQLEVLRAGFNECIPGTTMATELVTSFYTGAGVTTAPADAVISCVATGLDGKTGDVVVESVKLDTAKTLPPVMLSIMDSCVPAADVTQILRDAFTQAGLTDAQATCTANALTGQISISQLAEIGASPSLPPDIEALVTTAAQGCATAGG